MQEILNGPGHGVSFLHYGLTAKVNLLNLIYLTDICLSIEALIDW